MVTAPAPGELGVLARTPHDPPRADRDAVVSSDGDSLVALSDREGSLLPGEPLIERGQKQGVFGTIFPSPCTWR